MSEVAEGASGPQDVGNTADAKTDPLDVALNKALGPIDDGSDDFPPLHLKDKLQGKEKADDRTDEAGKPAEHSGKVPDAPAAPQGNAELIEAPNHWTAERKQAFSGLPPEAQKAMLALSKDLEGGFTRKSMELSDQAKLAESVRGLFGDHHRQQLAHAGMDEVGAIRYLMQLQDFASQKPAEYIQWAMRSMGVTPEHLGFNTRQQAQHQQQPPAQAPKSTGDPQLDALLADPETAKLRSEFGQFSQAALGEINALKQHIERQQRQEQEYARQQHTAAVGSLRKQWTDFRSAQDDHGQLKYAHADTLQKQMGAIMDTDPAIATMPDGPAKLDAAYQAALWARPDLRTGLLEAEKARTLAEAQKKADAEKAKQAAKVRPATGAPTMPVKKGGLDAAVNEAMAKHGWQMTE